MASSAANGPSILSAFERETILTALEEFTNALAVYHQTLKKPSKRINDISIDCILSDIDDFGTSSMQLSPDAAAGMQDIKEQAACTKLYEDSLYVRNIIIDLKEEIREKGTFEVLKKEIESIAMREKEENFIVEETEKLQKTAAEIRKTIAEEKIIQEQEKRRLLKKLSEEQSNVDKLKLLADVETRYVTAWEKARCEQNSLHCDLEIEELEKILESYRVREKNENRIHIELTTFLTQQIRSMEEQIKEWERRYDLESEMYEKEIRKICNEIEVCREELLELKKEYQGNQEFIDAYLAEKEALRKQKEREEHMRRSTVRIQAWWRGVMVRRKLGPYRPEEKKKKRTVKTKK